MGGAGCDVCRRNSLCYTWFSACMEAAFLVFILRLQVTYYTYTHTVYICHYIYVYSDYQGSSMFWPAKFSLRNGPLNWKFKSAESECSFWLHVAVLLEIVHGPTDTWKPGLSTTGLNINTCGYMIWALDGNRRTLETFQCSSALNSA